MPAPLPSALRARFEEYIAEGLSARASAARLKLSAATGVRWKRKLRETGAIEPAPRGRAKGHGKLAPHQAFLEELVAHDGDITLPELAGALEVATGVVAHAASIGRFVRKLGYTYKKNHCWQPKGFVHVSSTSDRDGSNTQCPLCEPSLQDLCASTRPRSKPT